MITIRISYTRSGMIYIRDNVGNEMTYMDYSKRETLRLFKARFGYRYVRGIKVIEGDD